MIDFDNIELTNSPDYSKLEPSDFIFGLAQSDNWVWITPKQYWLDNDVSDDSGQQPNNLPDFIYYEMEGAYSSELSDFETKKALLDLGFIYDKKFEDWNRKNCLYNGMYDTHYTKHI